MPTGPGFRIETPCEISLNCCLPGFSSTNRNVIPLIFQEAQSMPFRGKRAWDRLPSPFLDSFYAGKQLSATQLDTFYAQGKIRVHATGSVSCSIPRIILSELQPLEQGERNQASCRARFLIFTWVTGRGMAVRRKSNKRLNPLPESASPACTWFAQGGRSSIREPENGKEKSMKKAAIVIAAAALFIGLGLGSGYAQQQDSSSQAGWYCPWLGRTVTPGETFVHPRTGQTVTVGQGWRCGGKGWQKGKRGMGRGMGMMQQGGATPSAPSQPSPSQ